MIERKSKGPVNSEILPAASMFPFFKVTNPAKDLFVSAHGT